MERREFLKSLAVGLIGVGLGGEALAEAAKRRTVTAEKYDDHIKDYLSKMRNFYKPHEDDVLLSREEFLLLKSCVKRLKNLQRTVGHGNFYILNLDGAIKIARKYSRVGRFTRAELNFLEKIFYQDSLVYGFLGEKPLKRITDRIRRRTVMKVPGTGNYLYKGVPLETYQKIKRDVGDQAILTSGVRSIMKQFLLFLNKAQRTKGNLSLASRSLAPPGYSFHGVSDFDVGQVGLGISNFSLRFMKTDVYKRLRDLNYINLRYPEGNLLGVRFEPWHIKVYPAA
jgi:hypothetical protein